MANIQTSTGTTINLVRTGPRGSQLVVLVHAVGVDLTYWGTQIPALSATYDVIAYDLPGHGQSTATSGDFAFDRAAATLAAVIRQADAGPAHVVGLSVGGMIAQTLALSQPDLIASLVLIDTISTFSDAARATLRDRARLVREQGMQSILQQTLERWFTPTFAARRPDMLDRTAKTLLGGDPAVHAAMWEMIATLDVAPHLSTLTCPTLVLVGEHDPTTPPAAARAIAGHIPGAEFHIIPSASHMAPIEAPEAVTGHLRTFLAGTDDLKTRSIR
jgi:3-oxoadipate enol-lactonase